MSDRDKRLMVILLIAAILGGSYWGFTKFSEDNVGYEQDVREVRDRADDLTSKNSRKQKYVTDTAANTAIFNDIMASYNNSLSQEQTLLFLATVEKNTGVWLKQQSLDSVSEVYRFGTVQSTNPAKIGQSVYNTDNVGIQTTTNVSYECTYDQLKEVLTYLRESGRKATVTNMSYTYDQATDKVTGTMSISLYAIVGSERPAPNIDIKDVFVGTDNIFASDTFVSDGAPDSYKEMIASNYDMYLMINRTGSDIDTVICGQSGDITNQKVVSSNKPGIENVIIKVTGTAGDYKVSYQVGSRLYPAENYEAGETFICGESIELLIMSSPRGTSTDTTEINLSIINETDLALNAAIVNDDPELSRVTTNNIQGAVVFYR